MLSEHEDGDIIATFLLHLRRWCGGDRGWHPEVIEEAQNWD